MSGFSSQLLLVNSELGVTGCMLHLVSPLLFFQLAGGPDEGYLHLLTIFAYGTYHDYKGTLINFHLLPTQSLQFPLRDDDSNYNYVAIPFQL